jgi:diacylglycerol kinase family enzyme
MAEKVLIFANPIAGRGRGRQVALQLQKDLIDGGFGVLLSFEPSGMVDEKMIDHEAAAAISIGGDGTLRAMVERLCAGGKNPPPVLPIPLGTANLMGKHLGLTWSSKETGARVVETIRRNEILQLDAATANGKMFLLMAGVGIDAHIVHLLDGLRKGPIDFTSYVLPAAITLARYSFPAISVTVDGVRIADEISAVAFVGNVKEYGTGFPILTRARPDDGLLDVCVIPCRDRRELAEILLLVPTGEHPSRENVIYTLGRSVQIESTEAVPVQLDGDSAGFTPLNVEVLPGRVRFLRPV